MTSSTPTRSSTSVRLVALGIVATLVLFLTGGLFAAAANAETEPRLVWVCKYVGPPDTPTLQGVISTSTSATDGEWFTDAQHPSLVLRAVAEGENRGQAPEGLEDECPETPPGPETPPVTETTTPPVTTTTPPVTTTSAPPVSTTTPAPPEAAPTDLGSTQTTGLATLFAIAAALLGGAALVLRRGGEH